MKLPAHVLFRKELSLMLWRPQGILDEALVNEMVAFIDAAEERGKPFNRFNDLSALDAVDLNFEFVFHVALGRRLSASPEAARQPYGRTSRTNYVNIRANLAPNEPFLR